MRTILTVVLLALALPAAAAAGGWATAGLGPPDDGLGPGDTWRAEVTLKQHGVTPLGGVEPAVVLVGEDGARTRFPAEPTGTVGVYVAEVELPAAGTYRYEVDDGFSQVHSFAPFRLGAAGDGGLPAWAIAPIVAGGAALAGLVALALRRRLAGAPRPVTALD